MDDWTTALLVTCPNFLYISHSQTVECHGPVLKLKIFCGPPKPVIQTLIDMRLIVPVMRCKIHPGVDMTALEEKENCWTNLNKLLQLITHKGVFKIKLPSKMKTAALHQMYLTICFNAT